MRRWWYSASASCQITARIAALLIVALRPRGVDVNP
jgi:hypothetical protein